MRNFNIKKLGKIVYSSINEAFDFDKISNNDSFNNELNDKILYKNEDEKLICEFIQDCYDIKNFSLVNFNIKEIDEYIAYYSKSPMDIKYMWCKSLITLNYYYDQNVIINQLFPQINPYKTLIKYISDYFCILLTPKNIMIILIKKNIPVKSLFPNRLTNYISLLNFYSYRCQYEQLKKVYSDKNKIVYESKMAAPDVNKLKKYSSLRSEFNPDNKEINDNIKIYTIKNKEELHTLIPKKYSIRYYKGIKIISIEGPAKNKLLYLLNKYMNKTSYNFLKITDLI